MTTKQATKSLTDRDYEAVTSMMDRPRAEVAAAAGLTLAQVAYARERIRNGRGPGNGWTPAEDATLYASPMATAEDLASRLPGRSASAVAQRRAAIGAPRPGSGHAASPHRPGGRSLLAKTCRECGLLLPGRWFKFKRADRVWSGTCRGCDSEALKDWKGNRRPEASATAERLNNERYRHAAQALTAQVATMNGQPYMERDHAVLADPDLTVLAKALSLGRTFFAVGDAVVKYGYKSRRALGDPARDQWIIDNPNLPRVEEIRAALEAASTAEEANTAPTWDWDD